MGYRDPQAFYTAQNAQIAARTSNSARASLTSSLEKFAQIKQARIKEANERKKARNTQVASAAADFSTEYRAAKLSADQFAQSVQGQEGSNMGAQIKNALVQVGSQLNENISNLGENASQFEINQLTDDAIVQVQKLKNDLTTLYEGYQEWQEQKDMSETEVGKIITSFNPELQNLYEKLDNGENDVILQMNPANGNWLFIPIEKDQETFKVLKDDYERVGSEIHDANGDVVTDDPSLYKQGDELYRAIQKGAKNLEYNVDDSTGIIDATDLTQRASEGEMFKTVIGHSEDVEGLKGSIEELYNAGRFRSVDEQGNVTQDNKGTGPVSQQRKKNENKNLSNRNYLDRDLVYNYYMNDPEGISYMNTYIDNDNLDGQLQGLGIDPMTEGLDARWALRNALVEKALVSLSTPKKKDDANAKALKQVPDQVYDAKGIQATTK